MTTQKRPPVPFGASSSEPQGGTSTGASDRTGMRAGDALAAEVRRKVGKVEVNLGGTGEVQDAINVNNFTGSAGLHTDAVPNLLKANAEEIMSLFQPGSIDSIVANNIVPGSFNWDGVAKGCFIVLRSGGRVALAEFGGGYDRGKNISQALTAAGFKDVKILGGVAVTAVK